MCNLDKRQSSKRVCIFCTLLSFLLIIFLFVSLLCKSQTSNGVGSESVQGKSMCDLLGWAKWHRDSFSS